MKTKCDCGRQDWANAEKWRWRARHLFPQKYVVRASAQRAQPNAGCSVFLYSTIFIFQFLWVTIRKYFLTIFTRRCCFCWQNVMVHACFDSTAYFPSTRRRRKHTHTHSHTYNFSTIFVFYCIVFSIELKFGKCCPETPSKWATTENMPLAVGVALIPAEITCQFLRETLLRCPKCITISPAGS